MVHTLGKNPYQVYNKMSDGVPGYDGLGTMGPCYVVLHLPLSRDPGCRRLFDFPSTDTKKRG